MLENISGTSPRTLEPVRVHGKSFFEDARKLYLHGVTYGLVALGSHGYPFPEEAQADVNLPRQTRPTALGAP